MNMRRKVMFKKKKLNRIITEAVEQTVAQFANSTPRISKHFFYGAVDIGPENLVVWYLFKTDSELETAKQNGLCDRLKEATINNLIDAGYPKEAFCEKELELSPKITFSDDTPEEIKSKIFDSLTHRKAHIAFTTEEDIDKKANGDYHLYFQ